VTGPATALTALLGLRVPIVGAGMGPIAGPELAAAVTEAGGLSSVGAGGDPLPHVAARVRRARELTAGPLAVNVVLEVVPDDLVGRLLDTDAEVLQTGWGDPAPWVERAHGAGKLVMHRVTTAAEAAQAAVAGVDALIAQGSDAGGHTGRVPTLALVPAVVDAAAGVPVVAAGGIADGRGLAAALALGAAGAVLGTRLVASEESLAHPRYQARVVAAAETDSVLTDVYEIGWPGAPHRVLRNATIDAWDAEPEPRTRPSERPVEIIARRRDGETVEEVPRWFVDCPRGEVEEMALYAGPGAGLVRDVRPAGRIVAEVAAEAVRVLAGLVPASREVPHAAD
jgi:nitronate monooxygenase